MATTSSHEIQLGQKPRGLQYTVPALLHHGNAPHGQTTRVSVGEMGSGQQVRFHFWKLISPFLKIHETDWVENGGDQQVWYWPMILNYYIRASFLSTVSSSDLSLVSKSHRFKTATESFFVLTRWYQCVSMRSGEGLAPKVTWHHQSQYSPGSVNLGLETITFSS